MNDPQADSGRDDTGVPTRRHAPATNGRGPISLLLKRLPPAASFFLVDKAIAAEGRQGTCAVSNRRASLRRVSVTPTGYSSLQIIASRVLDARAHTICGRRSNAGRRAPCGRNRARQRSRNTPAASRLGAGRSRRYLAAREHTGARTSLSGNPRAPRQKKSGLAAAQPLGLRASAPRAQRHRLRGNSVSISKACRPTRPRRFRFVTAGRCSMPGARRRCAAEHLPPLRAPAPAAAGESAGRE